MRIGLITQDEPFFLSENIEYLIENLPDHSEVVVCCLLDASPFGKKESFLSKSLKTLKVFGPKFFVRYSRRFLWNRLFSKSVKKVLQEKRIPIVYVEGSINGEATISALSRHQPDLLVSVAGNKLFKKPIIELAPKGCLNLHTALLPKYRGLMPTFWVLKHGEKQTGCSVFFVDEGIDSGPIVVQETVDIGERSQEELIKVTKKVGMDAIIKAVDKIEKGDADLIPNNAEEMTYYSFPERQDVKEFLLAGKRFY